MSDPVCRFIDYMFGNAPRLKFELDVSMAQSHLSLMRRKQSRSSISSPSKTFNSSPTKMMSTTNLGFDDDQELLKEIPFYKKLRFINGKVSPYAEFKSVCIREGLLNEIALMMQPGKPATTVNNGLKLAKYFISSKELEILLREAEHLPIFTGLRERVERKILDRPNSTIESQLDVSARVLAFKASILKCYKTKVAEIDKMSLADILTPKIYA